MKHIALAIIKDDLAGYLLVRSPGHKLFGESFHPIDTVILPGESPEHAIYAKLSETLDAGHIFTGEVLATTALDANTQAHWVECGTLYLNDEIARDPSMSIEYVDYEGGTLTNPLAIHTFGVHPVAERFLTQLDAPRVSRERGR